MISVSHLIDAVGQKLKAELGAGVIIMTTAFSLVGLTVALVAGFQQWVYDTDRLDRAEERQLAANFLDRSGEASISQQIVQLTWDDAIMAIDKRDFAWADTYIGEFLWTNFRYDYQYLTSPQGEATAVGRTGNR